MRGLGFIAGIVVVALGSADAIAAACRNPNALGVSRVMTVDPRVMPIVGSHDYGRTLPLAPGEVVLTFDDGPMPATTSHVLRTLAQECVRATFFMVGRQARANPGMARQVLAAGHSIGTHSQNHPLSRMPFQRSVYEIDSGIASVAAALGSFQSVAPFFRFPGLYRSREAENYLQSRGIMVWSVDVDSEDWKGRAPSRMIDLTMAHLEARRGGIVLLHDIKPNTARALPVLLARLKARGFRIVHVVPRGRGLQDLIARAPVQLRDAVVWPALRPAKPLTASMRTPVTPQLVVDPRAGNFSVVFTSGVPYR